MSEERQEPLLDIDGNTLEEGIELPRTRKHDANQKPFKMPNEDTRPVSLRGIPPQNQAAAQIMADPSKREYAGKLLSALADSFTMRPVQSNAELAERIKDYITFCSERQVLPTLEGMALYCGYSRDTFRDWRIGRNKGFKDVESGLTTSLLVQKAVTLLESFDADMAMNGRVTPVSYIFRAKANFNYEDRTSIEIVNDNNLSQPMTTEEIVKNLVEPDDEYSVE